MKPLCLAGTRNTGSRVKWRILSLTHTSTGTHLSTTSNIFAIKGTIELKLCKWALVDIVIKIVVIFLYKVARKARLKKGPVAQADECCVGALTDRGDYTTQIYLHYIASVNYVPTATLPISKTH
jgi:hypothetical protein